MFFDGKTGPIDDWAKRRSELARARAHVLALEFQRGKRDARHMAAEAIASATHKPGSGYYGGTASGALWCANEYFYGALCKAGGKDYAAKYERQLLNAVTARQRTTKIARNLLDGLA